MLHEAASRLVTNHVPRPSEERYDRLIATLAQRLVELGVVAVHDPGALSMQEGLGGGIEAYRRLAAAGRLPLRVHACIREEQIDAAVEAGLRSGDPLAPGVDRARLGWLKLFADGTLASRTAALLEPIEPEPGQPLPAGTERGVFITPPERLAALASRAAAAGIATIIHAIGDHGVRAALDALEPTVGSVPFMPRLEHVQLLHPDDRGRFARAGIAASVQPIHLRADAAAARRLWGDRAEANGYTWRTLADSGAVLAFGTDAPVEPIDPWPGLTMAVTRSDPSWPAARHRSDRTRRSRSSAPSGRRASARRSRRGSPIVAGSSPASARTWSSCRSRHSPSRSNRAARSPPPARGSSWSTARLVYEA